MGRSSEAHGENFFIILSEKKTTKTYE